jgi:ribonuclease P protein component
MHRPFYALMRQLKKRAQFLNAARGMRSAGRFFVLQAAPVSVLEPGIGYTVTKRTGNSPERSRIKRRLRAAVLACQNQFHTQYDYVLIGRRAALGVPFATLVRKLDHAIAQVHKIPAQK